MIPVCETEEYITRLLSSRRAGERGVLAFYEHRLGAICKDPRLMLMPMDDHLAHRGDGVFESMKFEHGKLYQVDEHLRRMQRSAKGLHLDPPCSWERLREIVFEVARAAETDCGLVRILIGRGPGGFGIDPAECPVSSLYVIAYTYKPLPEERYEKGLCAFRSSIPAKPAYLAKIKNANYIPNVLMKREAIERGCDIAFSFDDEDYLAEGATENIALVDAEDTFVIPELTNALTGTTLMRAIDLLKDDMRIEYRKVREDDIYRAKEVMVLGTSAECVSVVRFEGQPIHDVRRGPVSRKLKEMLSQDILNSGIPLR